MTEINKTEKPKPQKAETYLDVKAHRWYNNGMILDKPWMPGEVRSISVNLYKQILRDLPDNWEIA